MVGEDCDRSPAVGVHLHTENRSELLWPETFGINIKEAYSHEEIISVVIGARVERSCTC